MQMGRAKEIVREALQLDVAEQEEVLEALWESATGGKLSPEWEEEIERRIDDVDSGKAKTVPGDKVMARLRQRYRAP